MEFICATVKLWDCWNNFTNNFSFIISMQYICATVKLWDSWNFWTNYLSFILYYGIHLCYCETMRLLKLIQKYFFVCLLECNSSLQLWNCETIEIFWQIIFHLSNSMEFISATVKLWNSWNFLTNNFSFI